MNVPKVMLSVSTVIAFSYSGHCAELAAALERFADLIRG